MAPRCCSCNGSGRCQSYCCVRQGSPCVDCYIGEERCQNRRLPGATSSSSQLLPGPALPRRNVPTSSSQPVMGSEADFIPRPAKTSVDSSSPPAAIVPASEKPVALRNSRLTPEPQRFAHHGRRCKKLQCTVLLQPQLALPCQLCSIQTVLPAQIAVIVVHGIGVEPSVDSRSLDEN